jgi:hypothetical protein
MSVTIRDILIRAQRLVWAYDMSPEEALKAVLKEIANAEEYSGREESKSRMSPYGELC